jgi:hypothetical protein
MGMNRSTTEAAVAVPPEEVQRRIAEYRRLSFLGHLPAQVVYQDPHSACPWPGCGLRIAGINFQLDKMGDPDKVARWLASWWNGPGLVARCPGCKRYVLYDVTCKQAVATPTAMGQDTLLAEDWDQKAHLVVRPE